MFLFRQRVHDWGQVFEASAPSRSWRGPVFQVTSLYNLNEKVGMPVKNLPIYLFRTFVTILRLLQDFGALLPK